MLVPAWQLGAVVLAWLLHAWLLGGLLMRMGGMRLWAPNLLLQWFFQCVLGMALNIVVLQALGFAGVFVHSAALAWVALSLGAWLVLRKRFAPAAALTPTDRLDAWTAGLIASVVLLLLGLGAGVAPGHWDDTMYHLPLAQSYVEHRGVVLMPHLRFPLFPQNMNLVQGLGLMWGDVRLAQALSTVPLALTWLGMVGASQWLMGARFWGLLAGALLWLATPVRQTWGFAYVDNGLALFCWAAVLALALAAPPARAPADAEPAAPQRWHLGWVAIAATMAATAAGTKYFGAVFAVLLGLLLLPSVRRERAFVLYAVLGTLLGSAWYVRSFWVSGDPVHPAGGGVFGHFLWSALDLQNQQAEQAGFGVQPWPWNIFKALQVAGLGWWGLAVAGLWGFWRSNGPLAVLQRVTLLYLGFWFFVTQVERYLAPVHGVASLLAVWACLNAARWLWAHRPSGNLGALVHLRRLQPDRMASGLLLVLMVVGTAPKAWRHAQHFEHELAARPGHALMQQANALRTAHGEQLTQLFFEHARFYFRGTVHGDFVGPARYWPAVQCTEPDGCQVASPQALATFARQFDSRLVLIGTQRLHIKLVDYEALFDVALRTPDGVLLVLRQP